MATPSFEAQQCQSRMVPLKSYINTVGSMHAVPAPTKYVTAHVSSDKNRMFGKWKGLGHWEVEGPAHGYIDCFDTSPRFHLPISPVLQEEFAVTTEEDGITYSHFAIFQPIITALQTFFPHIQVRTFSDLTISGELRGSKMDSRTDILLKARDRRMGPAEEFQTILLYEAQRPGVLHEEEWGVEESGEKVLIKNASVLGIQGRKYMLSTEHPSVIFGDTQSIAGICVEETDMPKLETDQEVEARFFFESGADKFLPILFGLAVDAIFEKMC
jgi:hypothetical protein